MVHVRCSVWRALVAAAGKQVPEPIEKINNRENSICTNRTRANYGSSHRSNSDADGTGASNSEKLLYDRSLETGNI